MSFDNCIYRAVFAFEINQIGKFFSADLFGVAVVVDPDYYGIGSFGNGFSGKCKFKRSVRRLNGTVFILERNLNGANLICFAELLVGYINCGVDDTLIGYRSNSHLNAFVKDTVSQCRANR